MKASNRLLWLFLLVAASARLLLQMVAMPPYAGLDEVFHIARLSFVREKGRNPNIDEPSVPVYLAKSIANEADAMPAFGFIGPRWPEVVRQRNGRVVFERLVDARRCVTPNYEAQQPSPYYSLVAPLAPRRALAEMRVWRLISVAFALGVVVAMASMASRWFGTKGILAAALLVSFPTWLTLVVRASNDAMGCALLAVALAITVSSPLRGGVVAEAIAWGGAIATKLYTWPAAIVVPLFWRRQRASRARMAAVICVSVVAAALTMSDLAMRTRNALGDFGFDPARATPAARPIAVIDMVKITVASIIWTSGQHNDALKPLGMLLFAGPLLALAVIAVYRSPDKTLIVICCAAVVTFGVAQLVNAMAFARQARAAGIELPLGGKEGWYWYSLAPLVGGVVLSLMMQRWRLSAFWIVIWDIIITEGALFHDYSGAATPAHVGFLFRWGPLQMPFTAHLEQIGAGPFVSWLVFLRAIHLAALGALFVAESFAAKSQADWSVE